MNSFQYGPLKNICSMIATGAIATSLKSIDNKKAGLPLPDMQLLLFALVAALGSTSIDLDDQEGPDQLLKDFNAGFRAPTEGLYHKTVQDLRANANGWASEEKVGKAKEAFKMAKKSTALENLEASLDGTARRDLNIGEAKGGNQNEATPPQNQRRAPKGAEMSSSE